MRARALAATASGGAGGCAGAAPALSQRLWPRSVCAARDVRCARCIFSSAEISHLVPDSARLGLAGWPLRWAGREMSTGRGVTGKRARSPPLCAHLRPAVAPPPHAVSTEARVWMAQREENAVAAAAPATATAACRPLATARTGCGMAVPRRPGMRRRRRGISARPPPHSPLWSLRIHVCRPWGGAYESARYSSCNPVTAAPPGRGCGGCIDSHSFHSHSSQSPQLRSPALPLARPPARPHARPPTRCPPPITPPLTSLVGVALHLHPSPPRSGGLPQATWRYTAGVVPLVRLHLPSSPRSFHPSVY